MQKCSFFLTNYDLIRFFFFSVWIYIFFLFVTTNTYYLKLLTFIFQIFFFVCFGFTYSLDAGMLIFLTGELVLILIFFSIIFINLDKINQTKKTTLPYILSSSILLTLILNHSPNHLLLTNIYVDYVDSLSTIVSSDFYLIFAFFFIHYHVLVILIAIILGCFSIFFILIHHTLKKNKSNLNKTQQKIQHLTTSTHAKVAFSRKQLFFKQANYKNTIRLWK